MSLRLLASAARGGVTVRYSYPLLYSPWQHGTMGWIRPVHRIAETPITGDLARITGRGRARPGTHVKVPYRSRIGQSSCRTRNTTRRQRHLLSRNRLTEHLYHRDAVLRKVTCENGLGTAAGWPVVRHSTRSAHVPLAPAFRRLDIAC